MSDSLGLQLRPGGSRNPGAIRMTEAVSRHDGTGSIQKTDERNTTYPSSLLDCGGLGVDPAKLGGGDSVTS